ncbi:hypothetical protein PIB30_089856 [Stylosanthes scabra]|uniref:Uncharacterized protein n=1 Tax=Stylosanthes scabra TaxID=79078 RepID=A0ABU6SUH3_9FABA|nr:hypothetical protein [Stylosanthes scabra]
MREEREATAPTKAGHDAAAVRTEERERSRVMCLAAVVDDDHVAVASERRKERKVRREREIRGERERPRKKKAPLPPPLVYAAVTVQFHHHQPTNPSFNTLLRRDWFYFRRGSLEN